MTGNVLVNIYNEGFIPWLKASGPIFGKKMSYGMYDILSANPLILMELTTPAGAEIAKAKYLNKRAELVKNTIMKKDVIESDKVEKTSTPTENINVSDSVNISVTPNIIEEVHDEIDDDIDSILKDAPEEDEAPDITVTNYKRYRRKTLEKMSKQQLKDILTDRGYTSGPYAPKALDRINDLIEKIIKVQKLQKK